MELHLNHFEAALLFALFTSVVFAVTTKNTDKERLVYGVWSFVAFVAVIFGAGWLMALAR
jgi:hypothetical protein